MDIGAMTPFLHALREREMINDLIEELCGARLTFNYMRIGGVAWDLPPGWREKALAYLDHLDPILAEYNALFSYNKICIQRLANVAPITAEEAINYNLVGPNLRACGVKWDVRKDMPYSAYSDFEFDVPIGHGQWGMLGDSMDRYMMRIYEMKESAKILRQALTRMPDGPVLAKVVRNFRPPAGECQVRVESARGDQGWYVVSDGSGYPWRVHVRTGSFAAMGIIQKLSRGLMIADLVVLIASLDVIAPEIDR
jgi:NADH-quinone oxidoreductase subunit D